jgi:hypothetical protein
MEAGCQQMPAAHGSTADDEVTKIIFQSTVCGTAAVDDLWRDCKRHWEWLKASWGGICRKNGRLEILGGPRRVEKGAFLSRICKPTCNFTARQNESKLISFSAIDHATRSDLGRRARYWPEMLTGSFALHHNGRHLSPGAILFVRGVASAQHHTSAYLNHARCPLPHAGWSPSRRMAVVGTTFLGKVT